MFIKPELGSMIQWEGRSLLFHSAPAGLYQYEDLASGEFFKWTLEEFKRIASHDAIKKVETLASSTEVIPLPPPRTGHKSLLAGLTVWEESIQARNAHAYSVYKTSGLNLNCDAAKIKELIDAACEATGLPTVSVQQLQDIEKKMRRHGDVLYACTPHRRGRELGAVGIATVDEQLMKTAIENHYLVLEQPSMAQAYRHYLRLREDYQANSSTLPNLPASIATFERRINRLDSFMKVERRHGRFEAMKRHRVARGVYSDVPPMAVGEMDDCYLPLLVVSDDWSHALGTPRLTHQRCRGTGYVAGFFLWCGEVSSFTTLASLRNQLSDKSRLLSDAGLPPQSWPYAGPFTTVVLDRGSNFVTEKVVRSIVAMGSGVQICPTKQPWRKPMVERLHAYILEYIARELPGCVFDDVTSFREYKAKAKAIIPLSALVRVLTKFFVEVINGVPRPGHRLSPAEEIQAFLVDCPPAIPCDSRKIERVTSMEIERVLTHKGVRWEGLFFTGDALEPLVRRIGPNKKVRILVNPTNLSEITVIDPRTREQIAAQCTFKDYAANLTLPEHQLLCRTLHARREKIRLAALIRLQREIAIELQAARDGKKAIQKISRESKQAEKIEKSSEVSVLPAAKVPLVPAPAEAPKGVLDVLYY